MGTDASPKFVEETISIDSSYDSDKSVSTRDRKKKGKKEKNKKESTGKKQTPKGKKGNIIVSSKDEDNIGDFAPEELRRMDVKSVGALGIDCLKDVERMRAKSKNIQGGISGKMRCNLEKAVDVINTLIYRVASTGNPVKLRMDNRVLMDEIEKLKNWRRFSEKERWTR